MSAEAPRPEPGTPARRTTPSGLELERVYTSPASPEGPGEFPFTRGIYPDMYLGRLWTFRQYSGFANAAETNLRLRYLLEQGQTGLSVAFDLPTQIGFDSDEPIALGEVGKVGVPVSCLDDLDSLLEGIPLERTSISMTINSTAAILLAFLVALARRRGVEPEKLRGTLQNDILKEFITRRTYRFPLRPSLRLTTDIFAFSQEHLPQWNPISVSGYHMREAGCDAVQEVAFTLANAIAYLEAARDAGIDLAYLGRRMSFFWNAHNHLFEEVAKFRAARRLWARIVRERFQLQDPACARMRFHTQTAGSTLTFQEPENNVVRVTIQALAAVLGGTQSLHTNSMDEALGLPGRLSARTALRTQQILAYESGVAGVVDPLGGCPLIEDLTDKLEARSRELLEEIDAMGGAVKAAGEGFQQSIIEEEAYRFQRRVESGEVTIVGVNRITDEDREAAVSRAQRIDPEEERARRDWLLAYKRSRRESEIEAPLERLRDAAAGRENLLYPLIECAEAGVTVGEMMGALATRFGEYSG